MEFKHNKFLSAERQIVTCNPDINVVNVAFYSFNSVPVRSCVTVPYTLEGTKIIFLLWSDFLVFFPFFLLDVYMGTKFCAK